MGFCLVLVFKSGNQRPVIAMLSTLRSKLIPRQMAVVVRRTMMDDRAVNNRLPQGLSMKSLKHHVALQPLFLIMGLGMAFVGAFIVRLAVFSPDVNYSKRDMGEIADYYKNKRFKFFNSGGVDYSTVSKVPNYKD